MSNQIMDNALLNISDLSSLISMLEQENEAKAEQIEQIEENLASSTPAGSLDPVGQFLFDLTLTEVDDPGGRKRDLIAHGYAVCWDYLNAQAGTEIQEHVKAHGFSRALGAAFCKFYYSPFGRSLRGEKPRKK